MNVSPRRIIIAAFTLDALLFASAWLPRFQESAALGRTVMGSALALGAWLAWTVIRGRRADAPDAPDAPDDHAVVVAVPARHWVPVLLQIGIFIYWGTHAPRVSHFAPLILVQIAAAYLFDLALTWSRGRPWRLGLGPAWIVLTLNLFMWFKDDWFLLQLAMVAMAFVARDAAQWARDGERVRVLNPSATALALMSVGLLVAGAGDLTWGPELVSTLGRPPAMYEVVFASGVVIQLVCGAVLPALAAAVTVVVIELIHHAATGGHLFLDSGIPIAIFMAINLLMPDAVTTPRKPQGRLISGVLYGALLFPLVALLPVAGGLAWLAKLLPLPLINVLARGLDAVSDRLPRIPIRPSYAMWVHVALWGGAFVVMRPYLNDHPGGRHTTWLSPCQAGNADACQSLHRLLALGCEARQKSASCVMAGKLWQRGVLSGQWTDQPATTPLAREKQALALFERACDQKNATGCGLAAAMHRTGRGGVPADEQKAKALYQLACAGGHTDSCRRFDDGALEGASAQLSDEVARLRQGCNAGEMTACNELGIKLHSGTGVPPDVSIGRKMFKLACEGGLAEGCFNAGESYYDPESSSEDAKIAQRFHVRACDGGHAEACYKLAILQIGLMDPSRNLSKVGRLMRRACDLGKRDACEQAELFEPVKSQKAPEQSRQEKLDLLKRCDDGDINACLKLQMLQ